MTAFVGRQKKDSILRLTIIAKYYPSTYYSKYHLITPPSHLSNIRMPCPTSTMIYPSSCSSNNDRASLLGSMSLSGAATLPSSATTDPSHETSSSETTTMSRAKLLSVISAVLDILDKDDGDMALFMDSTSLSKADQ